MNRVTQQQRLNLLNALNDMWPSVPEENVSVELGCFRAWTNGDPDRAGPPSCGTVACFGGWCAWWPPFREQGVYAENDGIPKTRQNNLPWEVARELFGDRDLFNARYGHPADEGFDGTDHALVTHRLRWVLNNSEVKA